MSLADEGMDSIGGGECCAHLHGKYPQQHGHKGNTRVTLGFCDTVCEWAQMILMYVMALGFGNAFQLRRLRVMRMKLGLMRSFWRLDSRMIKYTTIRGVS